MENIFVILYDSDEIYVRKLAVMLQNFMDPGVFIRTVIQKDGERPGDCVSVRLVRGTEETKDAVLWEEDIYKYQPVTGIAGRIRSRFPAQERKRNFVRKAERQLWYGVVSPCRHESAAAFMCTFAAALGEKKKVLAVLFTQFCGLSGLLELEPGCDVEGFYLELRRCSEDEAGKVDLPEFSALPGFDLMPEPNNPAVLYELGREDILRLTQRLLCSEYEAVVWMAEGAFCGMECLLRISRHVFLAEKSDTASMCRQQEFEAFVRKMADSGWDEKVRRLHLPVFAQMECGEHLLWQWRESALRAEAEKWMEEDAEYGS